MSATATLRSSLGFFTLTLIPVTVDHLIEQPVLAELPDALLTTAVFTGFFTLGQLLGERITGPPPTLEAAHPLLRGALAALLFTVCIWAFWLGVGPAGRQALQALAMPLHVFLALALGLILAGWRGRRAAAR